MRLFHRSFGVLIATFTLALSLEAFAANTRATNPNAVSAEILGRGGTWSIAFDHAVDENLAAGVGIGGNGTEVRGNTSLGTSVTVNTGQVTTIPVYVNYYFSQEQGSLFGTLGATLYAENTQGRTSRPGSFDLDASVLASAGIGYENRSESGILFRVAGYAFLANDEIAPWGGFTMGYSF
jgi:hypothetical protein